jgi:hypothetical protein
VGSCSHFYFCDLHFLVQQHVSSHLPQVHTQVGFCHVLFTRLLWDIIIMVQQPPTGLHDDLEAASFVGTSLPSRGPPSLYTKDHITSSQLTWTTSSWHFLVPAACLRTYCTLSAYSGRLSSYLIYSALVGHYHQQSAGLPGVCLFERQDITAIYIRLCVSFSTPQAQYPAVTRLRGRGLGQRSSTKSSTPQLRLAFKCDAMNLLVSSNISLFFFMLSLCSYSYSYSYSILGR